MVCRTSEVISSFYQKEEITEQVHNDDAMKTNADSKKKNIYV